MTKKIKIKDVLDGTVQIDKKLEIKIKRIAKFMENRIDQLDKWNINAKKRHNNFVNSFVDELSNFPEESIWKNKCADGWHTGRKTKSYYRCSRCKIKINIEDIEEATTSTNPLFEPIWTFR